MSRIYLGFKDEMELAAWTQHPSHWPPTGAVQIAVDFSVHEGCLQIS